MDLFGHDKKTIYPRYFNRGTLSSIGDDAEYFIAELLGVRLTSARERSHGFPDLAAKGPISNVQVYVDVKSGLGGRTLNGGGNAKFVIYASQTCLEDFIRRHFQRVNGGEHTDLFSPSGEDMPMQREFRQREFRVYYAFVKRVCEKGYTPKNAGDFFHFDYQDIYFVRSGLVKAFWVVKFLERNFEMLSNLPDDDSRRDETLRILDMISVERAEGVEHRQIMNMLKQRYEQGEIFIDPELFGIQSKKKGGLRGWDSVLEAELRSVVAKGDVWYRLEYIPGVRRDDYCVHSFRGVGMNWIHVVDTDDKMADLFFSGGFSENRSRINDIARIRGLLANTSFARQLNKPVITIHPETAGKMERFFIREYGLNAFRDTFMWGLSIDRASEIRQGLEEIFAKQNGQIELIFKNERK